MLKVGDYVQYNDTAHPYVPTGAKGKVVAIREGIALGYDQIDVVFDGGLKHPINDRKIKGKSVIALLSKYNIEVLKSV